MVRGDWHSIFDWRIWLVLAIPTAAILFSSCGDGGGIDVGNAQVELQFTGSKIDRNQVGRVSDALITPQSSFVEQPVTTTMAILSLKQIDFEANDSCDNHAPLWNMSQAVSGIVLFPGGLVLPPVDDFELHGKYLCGVQFVFQGNATQPAVDLNAVAPDGTRAKFISNTSMVLKARFASGITIPAIQEHGEKSVFRIAVDVSYLNWLHNVSTWNIGSDVWFWAGGIEEDSTLHRNIAASMVATIQEIEVGKVVREYDVRLEATQNSRIGLAQD